MTARREVPSQRGGLLNLRLRLELPDYDDPRSSVHVRARRENLLAVARMLIACSRDGRGHLPSVVEVGRLQAPPDVIAALPLEFVHDEPYILLEMPFGEAIQASSAATPVDDAAAQFIGVARAVAAMHTHGWVLGGMDPRAVYVSTTGSWATLAQFGTLSTPGVTTGVSAEGPPAYALPDPAEERASVAADVYGLGLLLYRLLTGEDPLPPEAGRSAASRLPNLRSLDEGLSKVIVKAAADIPGSRYKSVESLVRQLTRRLGWLPATFTKPEARTNSRTGGLVAPGTILRSGRHEYRLDGVLAIGGQGVVCRGAKLAPHGTEVPVLIKFWRYSPAAVYLPDGHRYITESRAQLEHEARMLQNLHRCCGRTPQLIDFFHAPTLEPAIVHKWQALQENEPYLVMSEIGAHSLDHVAETADSANRAFAARVGRRLSEVLGAIHRSSVVYKDLKPANVLTDEWGIAAHLIDLGSACHFLEDKGRLDVDSPTWDTMTPGYQGPEFDDMRERTDQRFDLYSLGATLFRVLSGTCPERDLALPALRALDQDLPNYQDLASSAERPELGLDEIPADFQPILGSLLERDRSQRCSNAGLAALAFVGLERRLSSMPLSSPRVDICVQLERGQESFVRLVYRSPPDVAVADVLVERHGSDGPAVPLSNGERVTDGVFRIEDTPPQGGTIRYVLRPLGAPTFPQVEGRALEVRLDFAPRPRLGAAAGPGCIRLRWRILRGATSVRLIRNPDRVPSGPKDGILVLERPADADPQRCAFSDTDSATETEQHYALFVSYGGAWSPAAVATATALPPPEPPRPEWRAMLLHGAPICEVSWAHPATMPEQYRLRATDCATGKLVYPEVSIGLEASCENGHQASGAHGCTCGLPFRMRRRLEVPVGRTWTVEMASVVEGAVSDWATVVVCSYVTVGLVEAVSAVRRITLSWTAVLGVRYRVRRAAHPRVGPALDPNDTDRFTELGQVHGPEFVDAGLAPGHYEYRVQAIVTLPSATTVMMEEVEAQGVALELPEVPPLTVGLSDDCFLIAWTWPPQSETRRLDGVIAAWSRDGVVCGRSVVPREADPRVEFVDLPLGQPVQIDVFAHTGEEASATEIHVVVPTRPVTGVAARPRIGRAELRWTGSAEAVSYIVTRHVDHATHIVGVTAECSLQDSTPPTGVCISYSVVPVFPGFAQGRPQTTPELVVPPEPPAPAVVVSDPREGACSIRWRLPPGMPLVTGWRITMQLSNGPHAVDLTAQTREYLWRDVPTFVPLPVEIHPLVADECGSNGARTLGWAFESWLLAAESCVGGVRLKWKRPPVPGTLRIRRTDENGTARSIDVDAASGEWLDTVPCELSYEYQVQFRLNGSDGFLMQTPVLAGLRARPRSRPPTDLAPSILVHRSGQRVQLTWPAECPLPSVDRYTYVRFEGLPPANLAMIVGQPGYSELTGAARAEHELPRLGSVYSFARMASNDLVAVPSSITTVTAAPLAVDVGLTLRPGVSELTVGRTGHVHVVVRRSVDTPPDAFGLLWSSPQQYQAVLPPEWQDRSVPITLPGRTLFGALQALSSGTQSTEGVQILRPGEVLVDATVASNRRFEYRVHAMVPLTDGSGWVISPPAEGLPSPIPTADAFWEVRSRWRWVRQVAELNWVSVRATAGAVRWVVRGAFGERAGAALKSFGSIDLPGDSQPAEVKASDDARSLAVAPATWLSLLGTSSLRKRVGVWLARTWCITNRSILQGALEATWTLGPATLDLRLGRDGGLVVQVPVEFGGGRLVFAPRFAGTGGVVQVYRHRPWRWRRQITSVDCREEPWLAPHGESMRQIIAAVE